MVASKLIGICRYIKQLIRNTKGQGMTEYVLLIAFIALIVVVALTPVGNAVGAKFTEIVTILSGT